MAAGTDDLEHVPNNTNILESANGAFDATRKNGSDTMRTGNIGAKMTCARNGSMGSLHMTSKEAQGRHIDDARANAKPLAKQERARDLEAVAKR